MITKILIGLGIILGSLTTLYLLFILAGFIYIFFNNIFSSTSYISYNIRNASECGTYGIFVIIGITAVVLLSYYTGLAITF